MAALEACAGFSRCWKSSSALRVLRGSPALAPHLHFRVGQVQGGRRRRVSVAAASISTGAECAANNPGYCDAPDAATKSYHVQQTMYRIKGPKASLDFYSKVLRMT